MRNIFLILFLISTFSTVINAQELKGVIVDENNQPLAYTTIYIEELKTGTISNEKGEFFINLKNGYYHLRFQHLGYQTITQQVTIPNEKALTICLKPVSIELKEVVIKAKGEDPAYNIIRKAIAKAPYYENQLSYYKSNIYFKEVSRFGTDKSKFIRRLEKWAKDTIDGLGEIYEIKEMIYDITYTPKNMEQIASAINNHIDSNFSLIGYTPEFQIWNIYSEGGWISPLAHDALSYYNYELINSRIIDRNKIYHISITPKKRNNSLLTGTIDIIDSLWCVYHFDLEAKAKVPLMTFEYKFRQMFSELDKNIWLPVNYLNFVSVMIGIKVEITQTGSIQYLEYKVNNFEEGFIPQRKLNKNIQSDSSSIILTDKYLKIQDEIAKLSEKEELSKRDMLKILNLTKKGIKELEKNNKELFQKENMEVRFENNLLMDEEAYNRDSLYWKEKRIIPLTPEEVMFINKIYAHKDTLSNTDSLTVEKDSLMLEKDYLTEKELQKKPDTSKNIVQENAEEKAAEDRSGSLKDFYLEKNTDTDTLPAEYSEEIKIRDSLNIPSITDTVNMQEFMEENITDTIISQEEPLSAEDSISSSEKPRKLVKAPSFMDVLDSMVSETKSKKHNFYFIGYRLNINNSTSLGFHPSFLNFNPVDGYSIGLAGFFKKDFGGQKSWETYIYSVYANKSKHFPTILHSSYQYSPKKMGSISLNAGRVSTDFNKETGVKPGLNEFSSLFFKRNYINYYDRKFIDIAHSIEAFNGFTIDAYFNYEQQKELHNKTNYSFFRKSKKYRSNTPSNSYVTENRSYLEENSSSVAQIRLTYTPQMKYSYNKNKKVNLSSPYPTFSLLYERGIKGLFNGSADYDRWEATISQHWELNKFNFVDYKLSGGIFPHSDNMHFSQFKHFNVSEFPYMSTAFDNTFHTLRTYSASTNEWYLSGFAKYKTVYLLIKHLPFFESRNMNENLFVSYLRTPEIKNYMEIGYALTDIFMIGSIGAFVGFEDFKYKQWGIKLSINLFNK